MTEVRIQLTGAPYWSVFNAETGNFLGTQCGADELIECCNELEWKVVNKDALTPELVTKLKY